MNKSRIIPIRKHGDPDEMASGDWAASFGDRSLQLTTTRLFEIANKSFLRLRDVVNPLPMRALWLLLMFSVLSFAAEPVNWTVFPKVRPWNFETVPQNHANIDASIIVGWITPEVPMRSVDRAKQAAKFIIAYTNSFFLRAVLMRDALDAISKLDRNFQALDRLADNGVIFIGRAIDTDSRYALGLSFNDGKFYRGPYLCSFDAAKDYQVNFWDHTQWTLVE